MTERAKQSRRNGQPPRAVAYVRVSTEGGRGDDLISPEIQAAAIRDHCARSGYELVATLEDIDRSGRFWRRRQIETAVAMVEQREADVIVVWKVSRVARNRTDWNVAVDRVETAGGRLESATEPLDTSKPAGRLTRGMLAELAAYESELIGQTWREVHQRRATLGLPHYGPPRLGYLYDHRAGYRPDPDTAPTVAELYRRYTAGQGVGELTVWLRAEQVPVPKSGSLKWTRYGVQYYLDSGFAAGLLQRHDPACQCGKRPGACSNRVHTSGAHEPIITADQWDAYRAGRDARRGTRAKRNPAKLTGLVFCDGCGRPMQLQGSSGISRHAYVCRTNRLSAADCPAPAWVRRDTAELAVAAWLPSVAGEVDSLVAELPSPAVDRQRRARLARRVADADAALARLAVDHARRPMPETVLDAARAELEQDRAAALAELDRLPSAERLDHARAAAAGLLDVWESGDPAHCNRLCRELLRVKAYRGRPPQVQGLWELVG